MGEKLYPGGKKYRPLTSDDLSSLHTDRVPSQGDLTDGSGKFIREGLSQLAKDLLSDFGNDPKGFLKRLRGDRPDDLEDRPDDPNLLITDEEKRALSEQLDRMRNFVLLSGSAEIHQGEVQNRKYLERCPNASSKIEVCADPDFLEEDKLYLFLYLVDESTPRGEIEIAVSFPTPQTFSPDIFKASGDGFMEHISYYWENIPIERMTKREYEIIIPALTGARASFLQ